MLDIGAVKYPVLVVVVRSAGGRQLPCENCRLTLEGIVQLVAIEYVTG
jgi:hypothetical protein